MLIGLLIGAAVGMLLGLTGAGGAILAIPALVHLVKVPLNTATDLSLVAVWSGALLAWFVQRESTVYKIVAPIFGFSSLTILLLRPVKEITPSHVTLGLIIAVGVGTLLSIWSKKGRDSKPEFTRPNAAKYTLPRLAFAGVTLGGVMTMTGLGGGIVLVPLLNRMLKLPLNAATPTSLLLIFMSSTVAGLRMLASRPPDLQGELIGSLVFGSFLAALVVRFVLSRVNAEKLNQTRKLVLTGVIFFSVVTLLI